MKRPKMKSVSSDGRILRSERTKKRLAGALYELLGEGEFEPSAQKVADRAGIGIRSVFRLFSDMDALYSTVNARLEEDLEPMLGGQPSADSPRAERVEALIEERVAVFERFAPYLRATNRLRDRSEFLSNQYRKTVVRLRHRLFGFLPEVRDGSFELIEAIDQATSFEAWGRMRKEQRLSRSRARAALRFTVQALLAPLDEGSR